MPTVIPTLTPPITQTVTPTPTSQSRVVFAPLVNRQCEEQEPNSLRSSASPLPPNQVCTGYANDQDDYFSLELPRSAKILVRLEGHTGDLGVPTGGPLQLLLYNPFSIEITKRFSRPFSITTNILPSGTYYVRVYYVGSPNTSKPYTLWWSYQ